MSLQSRLRYEYRSILRFWNTWRLPKKVDTKATRVLIMSMVIILGGAYIMKVSELSTTGYHIHDLENKISILQSDAEKLQIEVASLQSMPNISRRLQGMNMVSPESVTYFRNDKIVAQK